MFYCLGIVVCYLDGDADPSFYTYGYDDSTNAYPKFNGELREEMPTAVSVPAFKSLVTKIKSGVYDTMDFSKIFIYIQPTTDKGNKF